MPTDDVRASLPNAALVAGTDGYWFLDGKRDWVASLALSGMAAGADGVIVEVHYNPAEAQCDGPQALLPDMFKELMTQLRQIAAVTKKEFAEAGEAATV